MRECDYDPLDPAVLEDPFPAYEALRKGCPVHHLEAFAPPFFTLTRYGDVLEGLRDWELWSIRYGDSPQYTHASGLFNDPPEHTPFRKLFNRAFTPHTVGRLDDGIEHLARQLLGDMLAEGSGDFRDFFASRLPATIIAGLIGVPPTDLALFREMCDDLTATYNVPDPAASARPRARLDAYFQTHIDRRRAQLRQASLTDPASPQSGNALPDDLLSGFLVAEEDGRHLSDDDVHLMLVLLLLGGLETSTALLTNLVWRLLEDRSRWEAVQRNAALVDIAVEESLRFDPPVLGLFRTPTRDVTLHDVEIPERSKVMLCFASANRERSKRPRVPGSVPTGSPARPSTAAPHLRVRRALLPRSASGAPRGHSLSSSTPRAHAGPPPRRTARAHRALLAVGSEAAARPLELSGPSHKGDTSSPPRRCPDAASPRQAAMATLG